MTRASKKADHQRTVSWDESLLQRVPLISRDVNPSRSVADKSELSRDSHPLSDPMNPKNVEIVMLASMRKHPFESEAENHILSAIEARDHLESEPEILDSVPDIAMNVFQSESMEGGISMVSHETMQSKPIPSSAGGSVASRLDRTTNDSHRTKQHHKKPGQTVQELLHSVTKSIAGLQGKENSQSFQAKVDKILLDDPNAGSGDTLGRAVNIINQGKTRRASDARLPPRQNHLQGSEKLSGKHLRSDGHNSPHRSAKSTGMSFVSKATDLREDNQKLVDPETGSIESLESEFLPDGIDKDNRKVNDTRRCSLRLKGKLLHAVKDGVVGDFDSFIRQRKDATKQYAKFLVLVVLPAIVLACILFYFLGNPPTGVLNLSPMPNNALVNTEGKTIDANKASASYWILFFTRLVFTYTLAKILEVFVIDFLCLGTKIMVNLFGNMVTLWIILSRGWPFLAFSWGILNLGLVEGSSKFVKHWLYWQSRIGVFNEQNPSGAISSNAVYRHILVLAIFSGFATSLKRLWLGLYLGRKTYWNYAEELAKVMKKILLLCEVASLARRLDHDANIIPGFHGEIPTIEDCGMDRDNFERIVQEYDEEDPFTQDELNETLSRSQHARNAVVIDPTDYSSGGGLTDAQKSKVNELLGEWEEPEKELGIEENVSVRCILQFRQSLSYLNNDFMFSFAWGEVSTRELCIISTQEVYKRLLSRTPHQSLLSFDVLALIAVLPDHTLEIDKLKDLIRLLRPDRDGKLGMLDFVKSVDDVYKEARLLRASVRNSQKIDRAIEKAINFLFYIVLMIVSMIIMRLDPLAFLAAVSTIILGVAFIIGTASSKMFEGFLFILVRRPYDIGDRIHVSCPDTDTSTSGSLSWIVKDVDLFTTTVVLAATGEKATLSNGSLASSRVINMARSPNASLFITLRFAVDTPYSKIEIFEEALRKFVKSRPREWVQLVSFRAKDVLQDLGYVEYIVFMQHRESWQNLGALLMSKARVASFCLELSKKLDMRYRSPPLPVDLTIANKEYTESESVIAKFQALSSTAGDDVAEMFEGKH